MLYMNELTEFLQCNEIEVLLFPIYIEETKAGGMLYLAAQLLKLRKQAAGPRFQIQGHPFSDTALAVESLVDLVRKKNLTTICNTLC